MQTYSLNDYIFVNLTPHGEEILKNWASQIPEKIGVTPKHWLCETGEYKFQLWEFASIFGQFMCNGCKPITDTIFFKIKPS